MLCLIASTFFAHALALSGKTSTIIGPDGEPHAEILLRVERKSISLKKSIAPPAAGPVRQLVNGSTPTGWIEIGTPRKWLYVIFDTGSDKLVAKTWDTVANELSSIDQGVEGMVTPSAVIYDHNHSSSYHRRFRVSPTTHELMPDHMAITYGSGTAITEVGSDTVRVGQRSLTNFTLMEITRDNLQLLHTSTGIAGILGLQHMKNKSLGNSLFSRLRDNGTMTAFGYCRGSADNGTFIWGDDSTEGQAMNVIGEMHWAVKLGDVQVTAKHSSLLTKDDSTSKPRRAKTHDIDIGDLEDVLGNDGDADGFGVDDGFDSDTKSSSSDEALTLSNPCPSMGCTGILDTGSNIIAGPRSFMAALTEVLNVKTDCSNFDELPPLSMNLSGMTVVIQPHSYVMKVPMPAGGFRGEQGDMEKERHEDDDDEAGDDKDVDNEQGDFANGATEEAGLTQKRASSMSSSVRRWKAAFARLKKLRGIDFGEMVDDLLSKLRKQKRDPQFVCMPALVPLDKQTQYGPLWIVGTPLLDSYYARWSFGKNATAPQIHIKALQDAEVCQQSSGHTSPSPANVSMEDKRKQFIKHAAKARYSHKRRALIERKLEDIAYPHWATELWMV